MSERYLCEVCDEPVEEGEPSVRIAADSAMSDGDGGCQSLTNREVMIFALFHSQCVISTYYDDFYDDVQYIDEARELISEAPLCNECHGEIFQKSKPVLTLLQGGIS